MIKYKVKLQISYAKTYFTFSNMAEAGAFAETILTHLDDSEDERKNAYVMILVINTELEEKEEDDDDL